jgi:hypothetical protein
LIALGALQIGWGAFVVPVLNAQAGSDLAERMRDRELAKKILQEFDSVAAQSPIPLFVFGGITILLGVAALRLGPPKERKVRIEEIRRLAEDLPMSAMPPDFGELEPVCEAPRPKFVADWMDWSVWRERRTGQIWLLQSGGVANAAVWYGPGNPNALNDLLNENI